MPIKLTKKIALIKGFSKQVEKYHKPLNRANKYILNFGLIFKIKSFKIYIGYRLLNFWVNTYMPNVPKKKDIKFFF